MGKGLPTSGMRWSLGGGSSSIHSFTPIVPAARPTVLKTDPGLTLLKEQQIVSSWSGSRSQT